MDHRHRDIEVPRADPPDSTGGPLGKTRTKKMNTAGSQSSYRFAIGLIILVLTSWSTILVAYHYLINPIGQTAADCEVGRAVPTVQSGPKTRTWKNWPAVAHENVGAPLVVKGESFFNHARELYFQKQPSGNTLMDEFLEVYKNRPDPVNMCGIRINHAMALFLAVKQINPTLVVESGVNAGVSTYFIRSASPTTKIFAIDPAEKPICNQGERWVDSSDLTINYTGKNFVDLMDLDWKGMVEKKEVDPESTLLFMDDHLHVFKRLAGVMKFGFRHILIEDNYKYGEGAYLLILFDSCVLVFTTSANVSFIYSSVHVTVTKQKTKVRLPLIRSAHQSKCLEALSGRLRGTGCSII